MAAIVDVEVISIVTPEVNSEDCDGSSDTVIVRVTDEDGLQGIGEADAPPNVVSAYFAQPNLHIWSQSIRDIVIGADPFEITALFDRVYDGTAYPGRRGLGVHALSALDVAIHDLVGKQLGRPVYQLLGGSRRADLRPYATIFPGLPNGRSLDEVMTDIRRRFEKALDAGFRAVKMEVMFYDAATDRQLVDAIRQGRSWLGDDITMMLDFGYRWRDWRDALWVLRRIEECNIYFAEAPLNHDDIVGHGCLAERSEIRIGGAEWSATRFECREWLAAGVDVLQPDINRCGGLTEIMRIAAEADAQGRTVVPHGWKTGITAAAGRHFHAATANSPTFEFLSPLLWPSPIRKELVHPEPQIRDGLMALPEGPGLGIELDPEVVERYRVDVAMSAPG
ncbi:MAG TPA: mandelate racemase/muconate lactonizing enzyme family protein [Gaiellaceae bacterium]|nr:mandelate racemase/muconate lactonizing enzyme family protein [Gaiellaceae bacterium]